MKILKIIFFFSIILLIVTTILTYILKQKYSIDKILDDLEKKYNVEIELKEKIKLKFFPNIKLNFTSKIKNNLENYFSEKINFSFTQNYNFSPIIFTINADSFFFKNLELKFLEILGSYNFIEKKINIKNMIGKIGDGNLNLQAIVDYSNKRHIQLQGNLNNLYLNQLLRQLGLANWQRIDLRLSSNKFLLSSTNDANFLQKIEGSIPITGSMHFIVTEEEKFGIAFLRLLIEKMPNFNNLGKSLSQIVDGFAGSPALFKGELNIKEGKINTDNLNVKNNNNRINIKGSYDMIKDVFDAKIYFFESNKLIVEANVLGKIDNPSIQVVNKNITLKNEENNKDIKKLFEEGIQKLIDKLLNTSE